MSTAELQQQGNQGDRPEERRVSGPRQRHPATAAPVAGAPVTAGGLTPMQQRLLAEVAHELRTPIQGIAGLADFALGQPLQPTLRETLALVRGAADELLAMTRDILDHARAEAGQLALQAVPFDVRDCVGASLAVMTAVAQEKGLSLQWRAAPELPDRLIGDPHRLRQVLLNLVGNGIKFSDLGSLDVSAEVVRRAGHRICCRFDVRDCGSGIPPDQLEAIFKPFHQGDGTPAINHGGVGLGLAIARRLVESMEGRLWVDSELGKGSTFHFTAWFGLGAPAHSEDAEDAEHAEHAEDPDSPGTGAAGLAAASEGAADGMESPRSLKLLLADDEAVNRRLTERILRAAGHQVISVDNGGAALAALSGDLFDVALLDLRMPGLNGIEIIQRIRSRESASGRVVRHLPLVMVTAHHDPAVFDLCKALGADACLAKPVAAEDLCRIVVCLAKVGARPMAEAPGDQRLDVAALLERVGHDEVFLREIILSFRASGQRHLRQARRALKRGQAGELAQAFHALGGMLGSVAATGMRQQAARLERLALGGSQTELPPLLEGFARNLQGVEAQLDQVLDSWPRASRLPPGRRPPETQARARAVKAAPQQQDELCLQP